MHIRIDQTQLAEALTWVANCAPNMTGSPVLSGVLLAAADDVVTLSAFDYEVAATAMVEAHVEQSGSVLVPARMLAHIVKELPKGFPVTLTSDGSFLAMKAAGGVFSLPTMPVEDYPQLPALPSQVGEVDAAEWAIAAKRASMAASKDDTLAGLTGVLLEFGDGLAVVATDRYRLSASEIGWQSTIDGRHLRPLLVPAVSMAMTTTGTTGTVGVHLDTGGPDVIGFTSGHRQIVTRLVDGTPMPWRRLMPATFLAEVTLPSAVLDAVLRRAAAFVGSETTKYAPTVTLAFENDELTVTSGDSDIGAGSEVVAVDYAAEPMQVVCKIAYLRDALKAAGSDRVSLSLLDGMRPLVVSPVGDVTFRHLVMPMRSPTANAA